MANEIMEVLEAPISTQTHECSLKNTKLIAHTKAIEKLMTATKRNMFEISARLLVIRNENLFEDDGFKDIFDYAGELFGYKKNMVYKLTTAAEKFIEQNPQGKGYVSILTHDNEDYSVSQLIELNSIEPDVAIKLDEQEVINPSMSTKEIREVVKSYKKGEIDENGNFQKIEDGEAEPEVEGEVVEKEAVDVTAKLIIQTANNISIILEDERIIKDTMKVSKLQEIRDFLNSISL